MKAVARKSFRDPKRQSATSNGWCARIERIFRVCQPHRSSQQAPRISCFNSRSKATQRTFVDQHHATLDQSVLHPLESNWD